MNLQIREGESSFRMRRIPIILLPPISTHAHTDTLTHTDTHTDIHTDTHTHTSKLVGDILSSSS